MPDIRKRIAALPSGLDGVRMAMEWPGEAGGRVVFRELDGEVTVGRCSGGRISKYPSKIDPYAKVNREEDPRFSLFGVVEFGLVELKPFIKKRGEGRSPQLSVRVVA